LMKYKKSETQLNGQRAYYDGFIQQCMQRDYKESAKPPQNYPRI
jgi:hypothetical protein